MRRSRLLAGLLPALLLMLPMATMAQNTPPERLDGTFQFIDRDQGINNQLEFVVEGDRNAAMGVVTGLAGTDVAVITYTTMWPNGFSASERSASVSQDREVHVRLELMPGAMSLTPAYDGEALPSKCKLQAKIRDNEINDPDDPDKADAKLKCDLGPDLRELDDGGPFGSPPQPVLDAVEAAFAARKDVKIKMGNGNIQIKHKGDPAP
jgi:hypothetical protein